MSSTLPLPPIQAAPLGADDRRRFALFMLFALLLLAAGIGLRDPWPSDEPRFTLVAKQMVESGDWLFPHRGTQLYADKPPVLMWMEAAGFEIFHNWRIAFLLPSLFAGLLSVGLTWDLGRKLWNPRVGLFAAGALLAVFQFEYQVKRAQIDPLVMGWITLANWALLLHFLRGPDWRKYWLGCSMAGLGVITKGVGFLALLMLVPYFAGRAKGWDVIRTQRSAWRWWLGALAFLLPIALWLAPMLLIARARGTAEYTAYVHDILFHQTAERYSESWSHPQPFWYFLPIVLFNWFPFSLAYPGLFPRWREAWRAREARVLLPLLWSAMVLLFFSIPVGKRDVYVMPILPMVALAAGPYLEEIAGKRWLRISAFCIALVGGVVIIGAGMLAMRGHPAATRMVVDRGLTDGGRSVWWMMLCAGAAYVIAALACMPRRGLHALLAGTTAFWLIWSLWAYPVLNDSSSSVGIMRRAGELIGKDAQLGLVGWREQNLLMADRPATDFGFLAPTAQQFARATQWQAADPQRRWVFAIDDAIGRCVDRSRALRVGVANRRTWWVYRHEAVVPDCVPEPAKAKPDEPGM
ncbi:MAG TPA: glycosyltransferase family 39 protein [Xanthomonadaceae bacterium]|jgi:4-amino-4-deoxy-L-arabinose transferase-like glycosyltransferase